MPWSTVRVGCPPGFNPRRTMAGVLLILGIVPMSSLQAGPTGVNRALVPEPRRTHSLGTLQPAPSPEDSQLDSWVTVVDESFENGLQAWTITDVSGAGAMWGDWDCSASDGTRSAGCAAGGPNAIACDDPYPNNMKTWMTLDPITFESLAMDARLAFHLRLDVEQRFDSFFVGWSTNGIDFFGYELDGTHDEFYQVNLSSVVDSSSVTIGFAFASDGSGGRPNGVQIDDVLIRSRRTTTPIPSDKYVWALSDSPTDPLSNRSDPFPNSRPIYLWLLCTPPGEGIRSAELTLITGSGVVAGFTPSPGFTFEGSAVGTIAYINLTAENCTEGPLVAGYFTAVSSLSSFLMCFDGPGTALSFGCESLPNVFWGPTVGYITKNLGYSTCSADSACGMQTTSVVPMSWGRIRGLYR